MRAHVERWAVDIGAGATGWLDSTAGVTADGKTVAMVRFASQEAAAANSERPEQGVWWGTMEGFFEGEPTFQNCTLVEHDQYGDLGSAGFVQVMQGQVSDIDRVRSLMSDDSIDWPTLRPDILGTLWAGTADGAWSMAIYFTSEAAAREGEQSQMPPEVEAQLAELNSLSVGEPSFFDFRDPWLMSAT
ncbi:hypothetical protein EFK50_07125 [Nocardioides marmoriginsengisoli]|uniref:Uncharacterized protein n=2 Tax=Nocardioides marmoriginsengisoli TaxID=661483 RepID=A0A3N0CLH6_9ACTN|nr:hypothetical protein EFK50_07125 [Nocardioides marmoriginsengisoli]